MRTVEALVEIKKICMKNFPSCKSCPMYCADGEHGEGCRFHSRRDPYDDGVRSLPDKWKAFRSKNSARVIQEIAGISLFEAYSMAGKLLALSRDCRDLRNESPSPCSDCPHYCGKRGKCALDGIPRDWFTRKTRGKWAGHLTPNQYRKRGI